ncbi:hypothetical protein I2I11_16600 [Pontibacter sp. 172403-2]|uniref:hypothetical protein n=1 Tax=Pontibacter rufus TaxID=2791028 RepID=UPI0018AF6C62|nr:hypothetical protein [Pontibacter sp. 172403-2]MBF9254925.1 hypothetical protein [Pontibacter sp. 172403-2]
MAAYFDFHFHPLGKRMLTEFDDQERQNRDCTERILLPPLGGVINNRIGRILNSQACITQAVSGGIRLGVANIVAIEYIFATKKGILKLLEWECNGNDVIAPLDNKLFEFIRNGLGSYLKLFNNELDFYQWVARQNNLRHCINLLSRKKGDDLQLQQGKLNLILAIEGGHNLSAKFINKPAGASDPVAIVMDYRTDPFVDFLYLTLTHLSHIPEQPLCSHAYAFKMVNNLPEARPQVKGLTSLGRQVVRACVDTKENAYPILIDIKHMSLLGRRNFYAYRRLLLNSRPDGFKPPKESNGEPWWPIIATHMGVTGYNSIDLKHLINTYGIEGENKHSVRISLSRIKAADLPHTTIRKKLTFNPATVGLCDDDIEEIARSRGLIGISLDARILGYENMWKNLQPDYDYMSRKDFAQLFPELDKNLPPVDPADEEPAEEQSRLFSDRRKRELYLFCLNMLHVVAVINRMPEDERHGKDGWEYVCLGSDYDGLIDSLEAVDTAESLPEFEQKLQLYLPPAEKAYLDAHANAPELLPAGGEISVKQVLRKVLYENGERFVREWWG